MLTLLNKKKYKHLYFIKFYFYKISKITKYKTKYTTIINRIRKHIINSLENKTYEPALCAGMPLVYIYIISWLVVYILSVVVIVSTLCKFT